jgi:hypothetical protein
MQTAASGLSLFIAGRVVAGLGVGLVSSLGKIPAAYDINFCKF